MKHKSKMKHRFLFQEKKSKNPEFDLSIISSEQDDFESESNISPKLGVPIKIKPKSKLVRNRPVDVKIDTAGTEVSLSDWLTISSPSFKNQKKFPILAVEEEQYDISTMTPNFQRLNFFNFSLLPQSKRPPHVNIFSQTKNDEISNLKNSDSESKREYFWFWFRASNKYVYYSSNPTYINQLGTFDIQKIGMVRGLPGNSQYCFEISDANNDVYKLCALTREVQRKWLCFIQKAKKLKSLDPICNGGTAEITQKVKEKTIIQPLMIIPLPSKNCNDDWNYDKRGKNWECKCSEGNILVLYNFRT
jgi:hypothetical protein